MVKKVLKGILLWTTILLIILVVISIDSILACGLATLFAWGALCLSFVNLCMTFITPKEFYTLTGMGLIEKYMN